MKIRKPQKHIPDNIYLYVLNIFLKRFLKQLKNRFDITKLLRQEMSDTKHNA